jgi:hypothetical protein
MDTNLLGANEFGDQMLTIRINKVRKKQNKNG